LVVTAGDTVTEFPVKLPGFHEKVPPWVFAEAVRVVACPGQMVVLDVVITGVGLTVITPVAVPGHPPVGLNVTVYKVVAFGEAVNVLPVDPLLHVNVPFIIGVTLAVMVPG